MVKTLTIGIIAPSSVTSNVELGLGVEKLVRSNFNVVVHPQCKKQHLFFAGTDQERAEAFFEYAQDPLVDVLWCARGGYGSARLLPLLDVLTVRFGTPPKSKLLLGLSDSTAIMEYVRTRWNWSLLYAEMPGLRTFCSLKKSEWIGLMGWITKTADTKEPWQNSQLKFVSPPRWKEIRGTLIGGNLCVWNSLAGTPFFPLTENNILFFEDVGESLYKIDRMVTQLLLSDGFKNVKAIILGNFLDCKDVVSKVLKTRSGFIEYPKHLPHSLMKNIRKKMDEKNAIPKIFQDAVEHLKIPVAYGLPSGHGPGKAPLPLGAIFCLDKIGNLKLDSWDWLDRPSELG